uniref:Sphingomyelin phosphodiesterase 4 n=1 Tax=Oryza rufipogon TaxID=4529 RepID=A0A0E0R2G5_ORYRU
MPPETTEAAALRGAILAASTAGAAGRAVSSVADYLRRHVGDHPRAFFADALPSLLFRVFVASPDSPSFIDLAAGDPALAELLASLLAPSGPLLAAVSAADRHALLRFVFPPERLPDWLRLALSSATAASSSSSSSSDEVISPLLAGRVDSELHLSVFEYYLFWFAYYPISAATAKATGMAAARAPKIPPSISEQSLKSLGRIESWMSTLGSSAGRNLGQKLESSLYLKLLYSYLKEFVPSGCVPPRNMGGTLLHRTVNDGIDAAESFRRAEFFVHTLIQFWLVGDDFSPLAVQTCRAYGLPLLSLQSHANATLVERPPAPGLGDAVKLFVMYMNRINASVDIDAPNVFEGISSWREACNSPVGYWNPLIQRPLYRFLLRTFLFCPMGVEIKNVAQVFSAWIVYMEPWKAQKDDLDAYDLPPPGCHNVHRVTEGKRQVSEAVYSPEWENFVLSNYLFYSSLVVHFLGFAHKFIHSDVSSVLQMVSKVLEVLASSTELLGLIYSVDATYHHRFFGSASCYLDHVLKYVPSIREQLQDWEYGLSESDADGSFLHERRNFNLRLFSFDEEGAYNLLQLLLLRAESEIQRLPGDAMQSLQTLDLIKSQMKKIFREHIESSQPMNLVERECSQHHGRGEVFAPKHPRPWKHSLANVNWMTRPISDSEVAWLASLLIRFSAWLNEILRLDRDDSDAIPTGPTNIKFDGNELNGVGGPKDAARMVFTGACSLLVLVGQSILHFMRTHSIRINLRILASKKLLTAVMLYALFTVARNALS